MIVEVAVQEDVDAIGLSCLAGAHRYLAPRVVELLRERGANNILVIAGGIVPDEDILFLEKKGIGAVFGPGTSIKTIANFITKNVK